MTFQEALRKTVTDETIIESILSVDYPKDTNPKQDNANFMAAAMRKADELLPFDTIAKVMFHRACCKSGYRLDNAKQFAREHMDKPLAEKLTLLGQLQYMGSPRLNPDGDIETVGVGHMAGCPCWNFSGCVPVNGPMPLSYCLCCGGHFMFHYQKALGLKLRIKQVVSSNINSGAKEPCVFIYEIVH